MKIIGRDNFDSGVVPDILIAENVRKGYALIIANLLNESPTKDIDRFYVAVEDDYRLYKWEP